MISKEELLRLQYDEEFQLDQIKKNKIVLRFIRHPSERVQLESVKKNGDAIRFIRHPSERVQLESVKSDGYAIQHIHNPSEKVQLEAVKKDRYAIECIYNPSEKVQLEAVKRALGIMFIHNPSFEVCEEVLHNCSREDLDQVIKCIDIEKYPELYEKYAFMMM